MLYVVALFVPPLAVLMAGRPGSAVLNVLLTLLLYFPGLIHAVIVVKAHYDDKNWVRRSRSGG